MTVRLWRIASDTPQWEAHDLSGRGAEISGGRWNRPGRPMVYCSTSLSLAALETAVHLRAGDLPMNRFVVCIDVPDSVWAWRRIRTLDTLPVGWTARPEGKVSLDIGQAWLNAGATALLQVPSVIVPEDHNVLLNPRHADIEKLTSWKLRPWFFDERLHAPTQAPAR